MRGDKQKVLRLRSTGKSYQEIKELLGVPKSTLSDWLRDIQWSKKIKDVLGKKAKEKSTIRLQRLNRIRGRHLLKLYQKARKEAHDEFEYFKLHPLFIAGLALYWGEGDRSSRYLTRMANTDPRMMRLFVQFFKKICGIPKKLLRTHLVIYPDLDKNKCEDFWKKELGLSSENFNKCIVIQGRHKTKRLPYGICYMGITSTYLKEKMMIWLKLLSKEFFKKDYYPRE